MKPTQKMAVGIVTSALLLGSLAIALLLGRVAGSAFAANNGTNQIGPIAGASQDGGTSGNQWANDTYNLFFTVHNNGDGTFAVRTAYKDASFVTIAGASPGASETTSNHGSIVSSGINGNFQGFVDGTVSGGTYNPTVDLSGCTTATPCTRTEVIGLLFGTSAAYNITSYNFEYNSSDKTLQYHSWHENFNKNSTTEQDIGDIANQ